LPCFEILPSLSLPPVECCRGTNPIQAARLRPDENAVQSPTSASFSSPVPPHRTAPAQNETLQTFHEPLAWQEELA
jgi:hypothetical protein